MAGLLLIFMLVEYVIVYPSLVAFQMHQAYKRNPLVKDVEEIRKEIREIKKVLKEGGLIEGKI